jgi:putative membrane protein
MRLFRTLALALFLTYLAVFPGSTLTVALNRVPAWGEWLGGALLIVQGAAVLCWLLGAYGGRGAVAALLVFLLAWGVEHIGVTFGFPFGRYNYTAQLQPQFFGAVPLPVPCAWLMVVAGSWQLATVNVGTSFQAATNVQTYRRAKVQSLFLAATLVLVLDLQIETVATKINVYWVWHDHGPYYGVPTANFIAWWLVGLAMALLVSKLVDLKRRIDLTNKALRRQESTSLVSWRLGGKKTSRDPRHGLSVTGSGTWIVDYIIRFVPAALYLLSTLMFVVVNLARGYVLAGLVGVAVLAVIGLRLLPSIGTFPLAKPRNARKAE